MKILIKFNKMMSLDVHLEHYVSFFRNVIEYEVGFMFEI